VYRIIVVSLSNSCPGTFDKIDHPNAGTVGSFLTFGTEKTNIALQQLLSYRICSIGYLSRIRRPFDAQTTMKALCGWDTSHPDDTKCSRRVRVGAIHRAGFENIVTQAMWLLWHAYRDRAIYGRCSTSLSSSQTDGCSHVHARYPDLWQTVDEGEDARRLLATCMPPQQYKGPSMYKSVNPNVHY